MHPEPQCRASRLTCGPPPPRLIRSPRVDREVGSVCRRARSSQIRTPRRVALWAASRRVAGFAAHSRLWRRTWGRVPPALARRRAETTRPPPGSHRGLAAPHLRVSDRVGHSAWRRG
eukprot:7391682-Prymnesium_polylepis.2